MSRISTGRKFVSALIVLSFCVVGYVGSTPVTRILAASTKVVVAGQFNTSLIPATSRPFPGAEGSLLGLTQPGGDLVNIEPDGTVTYPELTQAPIASTDGLTITFTLKPGMVWSNGQAITNSDYLFGYHVFNSEGLCLNTCNDISSITLPSGDSRTVILHLKNANGDIPEVMNGLLPHFWSALGTSSQLSACLAGASGCGPIASAIQTKNVYKNSSAVVAGPYKFSSASGGVLSFVRNSNFTVAMGARPKAPQTVEVDTDSNVDSLLSGARKHTSDLTAFPDGLSLYNTSLRNDSHFTTDLGQDKASEFLTFNTFNATHRVALDGRSSDNHHDKLTRSAVKNPVAGGPGSKGEMVRQALFLVINFAKLFESGTNSNSSLAQSSISYCAPINCSQSAPQQANDAQVESAGVWDPLASTYVKPGSTQALRDARTLFSQATKGKPTTLYLASNISSHAGDDLAAALQSLESTWEASFSNLTVKTETPDNYYDSWPDHGPLSRGQFQAALVGFTSGADPDSLAPEFDSAGCPQTNPTAVPVPLAFACFNNRDVDGALATGQASSGAQRLPYYQKFQQLMSQDAVVHQIWEIPSVWSADNAVTGFVMNSYADDPTWNARSWQVS